MSRRANMSNESTLDVNAEEVWADLSRFKGLIRLRMRYVNGIKSVSWEGQMTGWV